MNSYKPASLILVIVFMMIVVAIVAALVVGTFWLAWIGEWYGIFAIVFSYYMGVVSRAIK